MHPQQAARHPILGSHLLQNGKSVRVGKRASYGAKLRLGQDHT
jgi:hypothetical protein